MIESRNPASGALVFSAETATAAEVDRAVKQAASASARWAAESPRRRADLLLRFAELVERDSSVLASLIVAEVGKRAAEARGEVDWTALSARWYAEHPPREQQRAGALVRHRPLGVVATVTPWNAPLITPAWKWLPALVAGNVVVWKPSELATGIATAALERLREAGVPEDVVQIVPGGPATAAALCEHPHVAGVHFTGSTRAGRAIAATLGNRLARCALEMGGLNAAIVFPDADLELAADCILAAATAINGQKCTSTRRVLVERSVHEELCGLLAGRIRSLVPGDPAFSETTLGPLITPKASSHANGELERVAEAGATIVARSPTLDLPDVRPDAFFPAALVADVPASDALRREELFAPVISFEPFSRAEDAWCTANATRYGLSASVFTMSAATKDAARERLATGVLTFNRRGDAVDLEAPFGGIKDSGNGFLEGGEFVYAGLTSLQAVYGR